MRYYVYSPLDDEWYVDDIVGQCQQLRFTGTRVPPPWKPIQLELVKSRRKLSDFPAFAGPTPLFSARAWKALEPLIGSHVQPLPIYGHKRRKLYAINVLTVLRNAIDLKKSDCVINATAAGDRMIDIVSAIYKYKLIDDRIEGHDFFKLDETSGLKVYVSDRFKEAVEAAGLTDVGFNFIWKTKQK